MIDSELDLSKLRDVIDFEVDYIIRLYEKELSEKDTILAEKDTILAEKDTILAEKDKEIEIFFPPDHYPVCLVFNVIVFFSFAVICKNSFQIIS